MGQVEQCKTLSRLLLHQMFQWSSVSMIFFMFSVTVNCPERTVCETHLKAIVPSLYGLFFNLFSLQTWHAVFRHQVRLDCKYSVQWSSWGLKRLRLRELNLSYICFCILRYGSSSAWYVPVCLDRFAASQIFTQRQYFWLLQLRIKLIFQGDRMSLKLWDGHHSIRRPI